MAACTGTHLAHFCLPFPHHLHVPVTRERDAGHDFLLVIEDGLHVTETGAVGGGEVEYICNSRLSPRPGEYVLVDYGGRRDIARFVERDCSKCSLREPSTCVAANIVGVIIGAAQRGNRYDFT